MTQNEIESLRVILENSKKITIIPHRNPDGDALGSCLGLYLFLKKLNHEVNVISPNDFPSFLSWLPNSENILIFEKETEKCSKLLNDSELIFTLDFNALHRVGEVMQTCLAILDKTFVMIDHHVLPEYYAKFVFSDTTYGSTCEMVYDFIHHLNLQNTIDKTIATCIYTGIVTDSGSFRFPKTTSKTHRIVADLLDKGVENSKIHNLLFDTSSYSRLQLLGKALQNLKVMSECNTSYITLSQEELDTYNFQKGDTEGIVNYGISIVGINFTAIFIENKAENIIKISFRSQGDFDVNQFARNYFEGGGHKNAAGGKSTKSLQDTVIYFENIIKETKNI